MRQKCKGDALLPLVAGDKWPTRAKATDGEVLCCVLSFIN